jgi:C_GCAxxG_C_C family probable redox protein
MADPVTTAQERFAQKFNCSQSVFSAYASQLGIQDEIALKLSSPFGGGTAHQGHVCGAVTGALMVLGLHKGNATPETKDETYHLAEEYIKRFQELHGSILCRELTGYDISKPDEFQKARESRVFYDTCPGLVKDAAELVAEFINR